MSWRGARLGAGDYMGLALFMAALLFAIVAATRCTPYTPPPAPAPEPVDAGRAADCATYCAHARWVGCTFAADTPEGATCEAVCENVMQSGIVSWDLGCRIAAPTCEDIDRCEQ